jgi:hypothetical protein
MIIDMRLRPPLPSWTRQPQFAQDVTYYPTRIGFPRPPSALALSMDMLIAEMADAAVTWGVIMGRQSAAPFGIIPNDEIAEAIRLHPDRFVGFAGIDISRPTGDCLAEIRRCLKQPGFKGVSLEPANSPTPMKPDDRRLYPIYEECLRSGVPVSITQSGALLPAVDAHYEYNSPVSLYQPAKDFPKLDFIISHGAWPWVREVLGIAFVLPNIYVSPDLYLNSPSLPGAEDYVKAANMYLGDRLLFGTAYPSRPLLESVQTFNDWPFAAGVKEKVLGRNALRVMKMDG